MSAKGQAMPGGDDQPIIIVKKIKKVAGGHHGGAWKVAFADFMTALMALFLLLWLVGSSSEEAKKAIAGYFRDEPIPIPGASSPGLGILDGGKGLLATDARADSISLIETEQSVREMLKGGALAGLSDQVLMTMTDEGLQIEIIDKAKNVLFDPGSSALKPEAVRILTEIAGAVSGLENRLVIGGHTDSRPYNRNAGRSNWELSTERANAARAAMVAAGLGEAQLATVAGYADTRPRLKDDPEDASNRRISITVLKKAADPGRPAGHARAEDAPAGSTGESIAPAARPSESHDPPNSLGLGEHPGARSAVGEQKKGADAGGHAVEPEKGQASGNHHP